MRKLLFLSFLMAFAAGIAFVSMDSVSEAASIPNGSYKKSCRNIQRTEHGGIIAECKTKSGKWKKTSLSAQNFPCSEIENDNGELICTK